MVSRSESSAPSRQRLAITAWLSAMAAHAYLCRLSVGVIAKPIRLELGLSEYQIGIIMGPAFFWAYAFGQIPSSRLGERFGTRISLPLFVAVWSISTAMFAAFSNFYLLMAIFMIIGLSQAGAFPLAVRTISVWHPRSERALASGILTSFMSVGAVLGAGMTGFLIHWLSWQSLFVIYAFPGLIWCALFYRTFRDDPSQHPGANDAERKLILDQSPGHSGISSESDPIPWGALIRSWPMWLICGQQSCRAAAQVFFGTWFTTYLLESRNITVEKSGLLAVLPHLSNGLACLLGGAVVDAIYRKTGSLSISRKGLTVVSLLVCALLIQGTYLVTNAGAAVMLISVGLFCACLASPAAYAVTLDMGGKHVGAVFATMNMCGNIGAGILPLLVPSLREWIRSTPRLMEVCGGDPWNAVIAMVASLYLIAGVCWLMMPMRGTVFEPDLKAT